MDDKKLGRWLIILLVFPLALAYCSEERFRYPCQDPKNWDKDVCKMPLCDVTRTCPEHIFKGQRDPRLGPPNDQITQKPSPAPAGNITKGANCAK